MGISSFNRQVAVVAASLAAAAGLTAAGPAGATTEEEPVSSEVAGMTGVCGWFDEEFADRFETVSVCGFDGLAGPDGQRDHLGEPLVVVDRYTCFFHDDGGCVGEHHEVFVDRASFVVDPMLRQARIITTAAGCGVEVEFVGTSGPTPRGGISEYHGFAGGPFLGVFGEQTLERPAQWWGKVCGKFVVAQTGQAIMWRSLMAGAGRFPAHGEGMERA